MAKVMNNLRKSSFLETLSAVRRAGLMGFTTTAKNFKLDLENNTKYQLDVHNVDQYVRDVFVPCSAYDEVRRIFGWNNKE
jgi:hypothetical protein